MTPDYFYVNINKKQKDDNERKNKVNDKINISNSTPNNIK